jgi:hypothetical protein
VKAVKIGLKAKFHWIIEGKVMDSSPDLSVKLRRGSSDSRDSFYMGFAQGIDSDIEEVTTVQNVPAPPPPPPIYPDREEPSIYPEPVEPPLYPDPEEPPLYPDPEEPPIDIPPPVIDEPSASEELVVILVPEGEKIECEQQEIEEVVTPVEEPEEFLIEQIPPPPLLPDEEEDEKTNTSVTVIQSKNKPPSSSSSSISSALNELAADEPKSLSHPVESPKSCTQSVEAEIATASPPSQKSSSHKSIKSPSSHKSPPKRLNLHRDTPPTRHKNFDSDSNDSIAMDCKIDDDNRDDSSPTDSMPQHPTPPPLVFPLSLEKR